MSHYIAEVCIPPTTDIAGSVAQVMDYFKEESGEADWWDWYIIGGRFSGHKVEAAIGEEALDAFSLELKEMKVTVSGLQCGKQELNPASQIPIVDELWQKRFPGHGKHCILFQHARDQYGKSGLYDDDVCSVAKIPETLAAYRLIVAGPHWDTQKKDQLIPVRMWTKEFWNGVDYQKTTWSGNVREGLEEMRNDNGHKKIGVADDWLLVTVDYHN